MFKILIINIQTGRESINKYDIAILLTAREMEPKLRLQFARPVRLISGLHDIVDSNVPNMKLLTDLDSGQEIGR